MSPNVSRPSSISLLIAVLLQVAPRKAHRPSASPEDLDFEIFDLLAQGVAVDAEQVGGAYLVAARRGQRRRQQRMLDLAQDAMIEPGRRQTVFEAGEVR